MSAEGTAVEAGPFSRKKMEVENVGRVKRKNGGLAWKVNKMPRRWSLFLL